MAAHPAEVYESFSIFLQPGDGLPSRVQFGQCMVGTQASAVVTLTTQSTKHTDGSHKGTEITVHIHNKNATNHQFLQAAPVCLGHSPTCPARLAHDERYRTQNKIAAPVSSTKQTRVGVCVVIEHLEKLLITRRASTLRTFPHKWVFPGGHVNEGESLEQAAIRETVEETGLVVKGLKLLSCWESCFPTYLQDGPIVAHHLVIYFKATLADVTFATRVPEITEMSISEGECDAVAWLGRQEAANILEAKDLETPYKLYERVGLEWKSTENPLSRLAGAGFGRNTECLALGTAFVIEKWLNNDHD